ncbi:HepA, Superfamily II DNARNA helicase, SNF2 family [Pyrenophora tritici-repentis]|nr:DNA repair protein rad5 [Pyrenophora tritici-repentis]KAI0572800.1 DNA repair protein rad5 [Pyrenophora tritici-repentis]PZD33343.1 HepA, Superfamily II DNARNA helicase, SNF2 family [Pyrenophora tritici-repentis]
MCEFLRVYPYDNRECFESDIIYPWRSGDEDEAISRMKRLVNSILLRRTQGVVDLPPRTDLRYTLKFNHHEREHYNMVQSNVVSKIDAAISGSSVATTFTSIIQQINELRLVCNLGTHRRARNSILPTSTIWDKRTAQKALTTLATTEKVVCTRCTLDLDATSTVNYSLGSELSSPNSTVCLFSCLKAICSSCLDPYWNERCGCLPSCPSARVPYNPGITYSGASSPSGPACEINDEPLPTKIKALVSDLLKQPKGTKSIVFSFWTSTLDLVQKGLSGSFITYTRFDGTTSQSNRSTALKDFRQDPSISVILMTISCSAVGLDITAASRAYILEPQWNPTVEEQALARVHRMGQTKPVTTIRFVMENTFEERVVETQERKRRLAELLLSSEEQVAEHGVEKLKYFRSLLR